MSRIEQEIIALPAKSEIVAEPEAEQDQLSSLPEEKGMTQDFVRAETLGFFQLAVAYGVDAIVMEKIKGRKHIPQLIFLRDFHITNRYLNTPLSTYDTMRPYAGVKSKQATQLIVRNTLTRLYDNFPWEEVPEEMKERYPREAVIHGKIISNRTDPGGIKEITRRLWKSPEFREKVIQVNTGKILSEEHKQKLLEGTMRYWSDPEHRRELGERSASRVFTPEALEKIRQAKLGKPRPDLKGKTVSDVTRERMIESQRIRSEIVRMKKAGLDTTEIEKAWEEDKAERRRQSIRQNREQKRRRLTAANAASDVPSPTTVFDVSENK